MTLRYPLSAWFLAFVWTNAVELPIYAAFLRRRFGPWWAPCLLTLTVNSVTHPALWFLFPQFGSPVVWTLVAESWVTLTEAAIILAALTLLAEVPIRRAVLLGSAASGVANLASTLAGLLIWA